MKNTALHDTAFDPFVNSQQISFMKDLKIVVIGGGAAGFFAAVNAAAMPGVQVTLLEKTGKLLSKVRVSGGGRCNVTHACFENAALVKFYPRGEKELRSVFSRFSTQDTIDWFSKRGVVLKTEEDGRMFPITDNSETIINCLLAEAEKLNVSIKQGVDIETIIRTADNGFIMNAKGGGQFNADRIVIATGGNSKNEAYHWLRELGHSIVEPVPSLFTFNMPNDPIIELMGVSVPYAKVKIQGVKLETDGPLLVTHWGMSGPAILKASAWGARKLNELNYTFVVAVQWLPRLNEEKLRLIFSEEKDENPSKTVIANCPLELPKRLWEYLCKGAGILPDKRWADLSRKDGISLINHILNDEHRVNGKTTFKEEFVTCGGVSLNEVDLSTMQSKLVPGLYFAGEVLNVDGVTGGFNFQHAWSTGFLAAASAARVMSDGL